MDAVIPTSAQGKVAGVCLIVFFIFSLVWMCVYFHANRPHPYNFFFATLPITTVVILGIINVASLDCVVTSDTTCENVAWFYAIFQAILTLLYVIYVMYQYFYLSKRT